MTEITRPPIVALGVGTVMAALSLLAGFLIWRGLWLNQWLGRGITCPEGMCMVWMLLGLWGSAPAFAFGAIAAGVVAQRRAHKSAREIWKASFGAGFVAFLLTSFSVYAVSFWYWTFGWRL